MELYDLTDKEIKLIEIIRKNREDYDKLTDKYSYLIAELNLVIRKLDNLLMNDKYLKQTFYETFDRDLYDKIFNAFDDECRKEVEVNE